ncbi:hypothetical protein V5740_05810 [Croceibacterium sp. TMG7-5b_MA50]|uniref:hypothetical protein n=1 Tax=Croceibacterium sp. TMG7-5b_MA50 TaxID=3121290 RepID=UPI003221E88B
MSNRRNTSPRRRKPWQPYLRLPAFLPVPLRARRDGWTPDRQARFIGYLAEGGCVATAARRVGLTRESAYRLRRRPGAGSFIAAWTTALTGRTQPRWKFTPADRMELATTGTLTARLWRGRFTGVQRNPSISALLALVSGLDRMTGDGDAGSCNGFLPRALSRRFV